MLTGVRRRRTAPLGLSREPIEEPECPRARTKTSLLVSEVQNHPPAKPDPTPPNEPQYLTPEEAAKILRLSVRTLEGMRYSGKSPPYAKFGQGRSSRILYPRDLLDQWVADQLRQSTTEG